MSASNEAVSHGAMASAGRTRAQRGATLALLAFAQLIIALDLNIVFVALSEIGAGLGFSSQTLQWVVSVYTVFTGGFLLFGGRAADLIGQRAPRLPFCPQFNADTTPPPPSNSTTRQTNAPHARRFPAPET